MSEASLDPSRVESEKKITLEQAKAAVIAWAEKNGGPAKAKDALAKHFGIKMREMDQSQAEAVFIHFSDPANGGEPAAVTKAKDAVIKWAEANGGPAVAKAALAIHFGIKMSEIREEQAEAIYTHFSDPANGADPAAIAETKRAQEEELAAESRKQREEEDRQKAARRTGLWCEVEEAWGDTSKIDFYASYLVEELEDGDFPQPLIDGVLIEGQPMLLGGPKKGQKTVIGLDLALSLATGTPFLGRFAVRQPKSVAYFSGESGKAAVASTLRRMCEARGIEAPQDNLSVVFRKVSFGEKRERKALRAYLELTGADVLFIDPAYLCMSNVSNPSSNFEVGKHLSALSDVAAEAGATVCLLAHMGKVGSGVGMPKLDDVAWAGFGEWARQWLLVNYRRPWQAGRADLNLVTGHACHAGEYKLTIDVGQPLWSRYDVAVEDLNAAPEVSSGPSPHLIAMLRALEGVEFQPVTATRAVTKLNGPNSKAAIQEGLAADLIEEGKLPNGRIGYRVRQGERPVTLPFKGQAV